MRRRDLLAAGGALVGGSLMAGCLERLGFQTQSAWRDPPLVEDRPDGVYYPALVEGMGLYGTSTDRDLGFALFYSFPHRFWNLTGSRRTKVVVRPEDSLHLMASVWDTATETVLPVDLSAEITDEAGETKTTNLWPMLSPNMGFHYGDNVALPGAGDYEITLEVGPLQTDRTEPFSGQFRDRRSATMTVHFDPSETYALDIERLGEQAGKRGTVELMELEQVPAPTVPPASELPGRLLHEGGSGDAKLLVGLVDGESRFREGSGPYLYVSPRTPYNRVMLPRMSLAATIERDGGPNTTTDLRATIDPELGVFYGVPLEAIVNGDTVSIEVQTPPQVSRHDGYETAFLEMPPIEFTVG